MLVRADGTRRAARRRAARCSACSRTATYEQARVAIGSGDRLVLFTDGITEARNAADEEFGEDRLVDAGVASIARAARRRSRRG